jgi:hypothetical protein
VSPGAIASPTRAPAASPLPVRGKAPNESPTPH